MLFLAPSMRPRPVGPRGAAGCVVQGHADLEPRVAATNPPSFGMWARHCSANVVFVGRALGWLRLGCSFAGLVGRRPPSPLDVEQTVEVTWRTVRSSQTRAGDGEVATAQIELDGGSLAPFCAGSLAADRQCAPAVVRADRG